MKVSPRVEREEGEYVNMKSEIKQLFLSFTMTSHVYPIIKSDETVVCGKIDY